LALLAELKTGFVIVDPLDAPTVYIVVPSVQHVACFHHLSEITGHPVFDEVIRRTTGRYREFSKTSFGPR
jgi:hypothetical protein